MYVLPGTLMDLGVAVTAGACFLMLVAESRRNPLTTQQSRCMNLFPCDRGLQLVSGDQLPVTTSVQTAVIAALDARKPAIGVAAVISLRPGLQAERIAPASAPAPRLAMTAATR
jgi:hypothetical protein